MDDARGRSVERALLALVVAVVVAVPLAVTHLEVGPRRFTAGTAVVGVLLVAGTIAVPALLFSRWQGAEERRDRRRGR